jgi:hypothetical protein
MDRLELLFSWQGGCLRSGLSNRVSTLKIVTSWANVRFLDFGSSFLLTNGVSLATQFFNDSITSWAKLRTRLGLTALGLAEKG